MPSLPYSTNSSSVGGLGSVFKSLSKTFRSTTSGSSTKAKRSLPIAVNPTVVGNSLIKRDQLQHTLQSGSFNEKIAVIKQLRDSLNDVNVSSIPEIWYMVNSGIAKDVNSVLRKETLLLLKVCISLSDDATPTKFLFYKDIVLNFQLSTDDLIDPYFSLFIDCLIELTSDGKEVYDLFLYAKCPFQDYIVKILGRISGEQDESAKEKVVSFVDSCLKLNFDLFDTSVLHQVLSQLLKMTFSTKTVDTLKSCLKLIDTYVIYGYTPPNCLAIIVTLLSSARMVDDNEVKELSLSVFGDLLKDTKVSYLAMEATCDIIQSKLGEKREPSSQDTRCIVGCIRFLEFTLFHYDEESTLGNSITKFLDTSANYVMNSLIAAADYHDMVISIEVLKLVLKLLELPIIRKHNFSLSKRTVLWRLLHVLSLQSQVNSNSHYNQNMVELFNKLQNLNTNSVYVSKTVQFLEVNSSILHEYNVNYVLKYYSENLLCVYTAPDWEDNCHHLVETYYHICPEDTFSVIKEGLINSLCITDSSEVVSIYVDLLCNECVIKRSRETVIEDSIVKSLVEVLCGLDSHLDLFKQTMETIFVELDRKESLNNCQLAKTCVLLLVKLTQSIQNSERANYLLPRMLSMAVQALESSRWDVFLVFARLFVAMRSNDGEFVYFVAVKNIYGLCDTLGRNMELIVDPNRRDQLKSSALWVYPEKSLMYFPLNELQKCSRKCLRRDTHLVVEWCTICLNVLERFYHWEVYSFVLSHLCPQMADYGLFGHDADVCITKIVKVICRQTQLKFPDNFEIADKSLSKGDIQVAFIRTLSAITCYKSILSRADEDQLINSVIFALQSWNKTGIPCLHFLYIATYEFPESIKKFLNGILTTLQTRISSPLTSSLILDFLLSLADLPNLISNFTIDEFKRVFGIAFKFIQYSNDALDNKKVTSLNYDDLAMDKSPSTQNFEITKQLVMYITALSYNLISSWFLKMNFDQRRRLASYIIMGLLANSKHELRDLAYVEFITRSTFAQVAMRSTVLVDNETVGDMYTNRAWIYGNGIISISTHKITGESEVIIRKATTVDKFKVRLHEELFPDYVLRQISNPSREAEKLVTYNPLIFTPSFLLTQLIYPTQEEKPVLKPIPLDIESSVIKRSVSILDRIPLVNFFKIGIMYAGTGQTGEDDILTNEFGSIEYHEFLADLGNLIMLRDCKKHYVGGLDTVNDIDGKLTVHYETENTQMCFHVATMMPNRDDDPHHDNKKRHIGNDYVNIYWNDSGLSFDSFEKLSSQFSFINIVIRPLNGSNFFSVKSYRKNGIPGIFATTHFKLVSKQNLSKMVRNLCSISAQFSDVWSDPNWEFSWGRRLSQLKSIAAKNRKLMAQSDGFFEQFETMGKDENVIYDRLEINSFT
ncbi:hypothetical protein FOA43_002457 [Brettanomyces nanus]|uniref:Rap-GAP domain-containing protein n=1 Tax=Eeniella nana TaxID=13502 RepID=A0A875S155_EENNA|nr:uncharacterized protein FOA43_002457 [Brettanomyces nanus]QPG75116.1 hypothetical protein FOA43_002457 [Brettanomyces nanus]